MLIPVRLFGERHPSITLNQPAWHVFHCAVALVIIHSLVVFWNPATAQIKRSAMPDAVLSQTTEHFNDDRINNASFSHNTGYSGLGTITTQDMRFIAPFVTILEQRLSQGRL